MISQKNDEKKEVQKQAKIEANPNIQPAEIKFPHIDCLDDSTNRRLEIAIKFYVSKGFCLAAAAGMAANGIIESGLDPTKTSNGTIASKNYVPKPGIGFGAYQLTTKTRQEEYVRYAHAIGKPINDLETQLSFSLVESKKSYPDMLIDLKTIGEQTEGGVSAPMRAAIIFHGWTEKIKSHPIIAYVNPSRGYESSGDSARKVIEKRGRLAEIIYDTYKPYYQ